MGDGTHIEWTDATWNPITGCSIVSKGCTNCYAMRLAGTRLRHHPSRAGLTKETKAGPVWTGEVRFNEQWLDQPLRWKAPRKIFVCAHGDLFAEGVPDEWIDRVFAVMALTPQHTYQVLTKRPERMRAYLTLKACDASPISGECRYVDREVIVTMAAQRLSCRRVVSKAQWERALGWHWPLSNVWLGVSAEDQATADARVPELLETPAAVRFVSAEPLLGPIDFQSSVGGTLWIGGQRGCDGTHRHHGRAGETIHGVMHNGDPTQSHHHHDDRCRRGLDWIIVGGESGPGARPMHPDWARSIRDQCEAAGVAFLFKQNGAFNVVYDRDRDDPDWRRCGDVERQTPRGRWLNLEGGHGFHGERVLRVDPVGKAKAGRLLDGRTWDQFPEVGG